MMLLLVVVALVAVPAANAVVGDSANGHGSTTSDGTEVNRFSGTVTCMVVDGRRAAIKGVVEQSVGDIPVGGEITWWVDDNANVGAPDTISAERSAPSGFPAGRSTSPSSFRSPAVTSKWSPWATPSVAAHSTRLKRLAGAVAGEAAERSRHDLPDTLTELS
jgi:hypothetical protein